MCVLGGGGMPSWSGSGMVITRWGDRGRQFSHWWRVVVWHEMQQLEVATMVAWHEVRTGPSGECRPRPRPTGRRGGGICREGKAVVDVCVLMRAPRNQCRPWCAFYLLQGSSTSVCVCVCVCVCV